MRMFTDIFARTLLCLSVTAVVTSFIYLPGHTVSARYAAAMDDAPQIEVGVFTPCGEFIPTDEIPLHVGVVYGWRMTTTSAGPVHWTETLRVPAQPREWAGDDFTLSEDGLTAFIDTVTDPEGGTVSHAWQITEGDPAGLYEMRVAVEEGHERVLRFVVR